MVQLVKGLAHKHKYLDSDPITHQKRLQHVSAFPSARKVGTGRSLELAGKQTKSNGKLQML